jgi:hypothetical protein
MANIINDVSILTTIPDKTLAKFFRKMIFCICEAVQEDILDEDNPKDITELDIGIGKLYIKHVGADIKYRFEPNDFLEKALSSTVINKKNYLEEFLDKALSKKFMEVYKDL